MKNKVKTITTLVIGIMIGTLGYVVADNVVSIISANQVGFSSSKTSKTNIQEAVDELYDMAKLYCPDGSCVPVMARASGATIDTVTGKTYYAEVYLNPTNLAESCNASNSSANVGKTNQKDGCMKWYAYNVRQVNGLTVYDLILDHNTTAWIEWANETDYLAAGGTQADWNADKNNTQGPVTINKELANLVAIGWKVMPRMITKDEIQKFASGNSLSGSPWLYDYTYDCITNSCDHEDNTVYGSSLATGYWTSTKLPNNDSYVYLVYRSSNLSCNKADWPGLGLRPVISIYQ